MVIKHFLTIGTLAILAAACGIKEQHSEQKIVNGEPAEEFAYPFMVDHNIGGSHWCGGTVIGERSVLSAAHCFRKSGPRRNEDLVLGNHNLRILDENETRVEIESLTFHPSYDIVILTTEEPIDTEVYKPITLATERPEIDSLVKVIGWGSTEGTADGNILQEVEIPVVSNASCRSAYRG